ncbi:LysR substrate-binding domain-containing protein [Vibrio gazogenes]|uniref:LysR substrate-binding domain-containing protein n=1 Tax=Vibrio gazogenes TaxID=687 RepID=UPI001F45118A|nr:LysR substrate-binding domain-containing protein [Vibrio gazogenes]USP12499.1 LysR substrate-binding domain-containing protein [Vibrio gazogenes]
MPKLKDYINNNEDFKFSFTSSNSISSVYNGSIDCLISGDNISIKPGFRKITLLKCKVGLVCSCGYYKSVVEYLEPITVVNSKSKEYAWFEWCEKMNLNFENVNHIVLDTLSLALDTVKMGVGVTIAPSFIVNSSIEKNELVAPFGFHDSDCEIYLYVPDHLPLLKDRKLQNVVNHIKIPDNS